jgi:hypothetical protein
LADSKKLLEDILGAPIYGYRAPSFSINHDILKIIEDSAYLYDSSYNSFAMHSRYGRLNLSQNGRKGIARQIPKTHYPRSSIQQGATIPTRDSQPKLNTNYKLSAMSYELSSSILYELPISNLRLGNRIFPWGGGAYFRLIPSPVFMAGVKAILRKQNAYLLYLHPWEFDPEQPKVEKAPRFFKFRHYTNLDKTASKLSLFIEAFKECRFVSCKQYLNDHL